MSGMFGTHKSTRCCTLRLYDVSVSARATLSSEKRSDIWDHFVCVDIWELIWDFLVSWFHPDTMRHAVFHSFSMFFIVFCICNGLALSLIFTSFFPCLMGFSLSFWLNFHVHLWSTAKLNCLSLRRWTMLAMPGWQAPWKTPWMGTPMRAARTSSWWNSMPRVSTCGRASVVVGAGMRLRLWRRTGCDFVFESVPWR